VGCTAPKVARKSSLPTPRLWIHHSAGSERGAAGLRSIQNFHMDDPKHKYANIGYSFVIDNADGTIFEAAAPGSKGPIRWATTPGRMASA
jgi:hypothetical protein